MGFFVVGLVLQVVRWLPVAVCVLFTEPVRRAEDGLLFPEAATQYGTVRGYYDFGVSGATLGFTW